MAGVNYINITIFMESSVTETIKALKMHITFDPSISLLGIYPKEYPKEVSK